MEIWCKESAIQYFSYQPLSPRFLLFSSSNWAINLLLVHFRIASRSSYSGIHTSAVLMRIQFPLGLGIYRAFILLLFGILTCCRVCWVWGDQAVHMSSPSQLLQTRVAYAATDGIILQPHWRIFEEKQVTLIGRSRKSKLFSSKALWHILLSILWE